MGRIGKGTQDFFLSNGGFVSDGGSKKGSSAQEQRPTNYTSEKGSKKRLATQKMKNSFPTVGPRHPSSC